MEMKRTALLAFLFFSGWAVACLTQPASSDGHREDGTVSIAKLSAPIYPLLARQTRVTGDVEIALKIHLDGTVVSATAVKGHPLLLQAALDSARQSQYMCTDCGEEPRLYRLIYTFELGPPISCERTDPNPKLDPEEPTYPQLTQSKNHITVVDRAWVTCDFAGTLGSGRRRSIKCLYLWRCVSPVVVVYE